MGLLRKSITWPLCLLLGLSLYLSSFSQVLCIGDQGNIKIESALAQSCCETECPSTVVAIKTESNHHHDCAGCSDIPLDGSQWWQRSKITDRPVTRSFSPPQASFLSEWAVITNGCSGRAWAPVAKERRTVPIEMIPTVLLS
ncbi:MAG: hypothetical protein KOO62_04145 [candidate division Zixibacteria bacterium]|nr:hypothetical protein [candidate division Zixibacteria bacterium]